MKKNDFLNYVSSLIDTKDHAYYDDNDQYFYFYHNNFMFKVASDAGSASLIIEEEKSSKKFTESIGLTSEETIILLEKLIPLIPNNHDSYTQKVEAIGVEHFNASIEVVDQYLRNVNPITDIQNHCSNNHLENYILYIPLDGINHICRIGRVSKYENKREHFLTSVVKIPFFLLDNDSKKSGSIPYDFIVPSWKIKEYPILDNFVEPKLFGTDFNLVFENMIKRFPGGKELFKEVLECSLPEQNKKVKPKKI